jgi:hypothetical protein
VNKGGDDGTLVLTIVQNKRAKESDDRRMIRRGEMLEKLRKVSEVRGGRLESEHGLEKGEGLVVFPQGKLCRAAQKGLVDMAVGLKDSHVLHLR